MDVHSKKQRSFNMSQIKGKDTKPEIILRKLLWNNGYRYRLYSKKLPGKPDIVFSGRKKVIFVNGCFWHKHNCKYFVWPKTNKQFWKDKILGTVKRDKANHEKLTALGWDYIVIWECEIKDNLKKTFKNIEKFLE